MSTPSIDFTPGKCCKRQQIAVMDHYRYEGERWESKTAHVNRCCLTCFAHWAGPVGEVQAFTSKEWDAYLEAAYQRDRQVCAEWREKNGDRAAHARCDEGAQSSDPASCGHMTTVAA
jgi:hypothetical protein